MNFLELTQMVARESGTISGTLPTAVTGQTGRLLKVVEWTKTAWTKIQNEHNAWLWMRTEFGAPDAITSSGIKRYTAASWNLTRWGEWLVEDDLISFYKQSLGVSDEAPLLFLPWQLYRKTYDRGTQDPDRPRHYSISPANEFCVGPAPDDVYVIRGEYRKAPQTLAANGDIPEMPARFHEVIAWYALLLLAEHDEGQFHVASALRRYRDLMDDLRRDQLPRVEITAGGLA